MENTAADSAADVKPPPAEHLSLEPECPEQKPSSPSAQETSGQSTPPTTISSETPAKGATSSTADTDKTQMTNTDSRPAPLDGPVKTPFEHPLPGCSAKPRPDLTPDQLSKYTALLSLATSWTDIANTSAKQASTAPITPSERIFLTRECLLRYLRATSWSSPDAAAKRLLATLTWRREYGLESHTADYISPENETGKQHILGFDNSGRPCLYMNPSRQNTLKSDRQIQHLVFMVERVIDLMEAGQETMALLINFKDSSQGQNATLAQAKQTLNILQGHYPERLGRALAINLPWYITTFFKLVGPFIDPVSKEKMVFNDDLRKHVPPVQLDKVCNGDADFEYDHGVYWPALIKLCEERRAAYVQLWEKAGSRIGEFEAYLRGGDQKPLMEVEKELDIAASEASAA